MSRAYAWYEYFPRTQDIPKFPEDGKKPKDFYRYPALHWLNRTGEQYEGTRIQQPSYVEADPPTSQLMRLIWVWAA